MWKNISAVQATVMTEGEGLGAIFLMPVACHFEMFGGHQMRRKKIIRIGSKKKTAKHRETFKVN